MSWPQNRSHQNLNLAYFTGYMVCASAHARILFQTMHSIITCINIYIMTYQGLSETEKLVLPFAITLSNNAWYCIQHGKHIAMTKFTLGTHKNDPIQSSGFQYTWRTLQTSFTWSQIRWWCGLGEITAVSSVLTHWGREKMTAIFHFSNGFSWMKMYEFRLTFHWSLFLGVKLTTFQHWFR